MANNLQCQIAQKPKKLNHCYSQGKKVDQNWSVYLMESYKQILPCVLDCNAKIIVT